MALNNQIDDVSLLQSSLSSKISQNKSLLITASPIPIIVDDDVDVPDSNSTLSSHNPSQIITNNISIDNDEDLLKPVENISSFDANIDVEVKPPSPPNPDFAAASSLVPSTVLATDKPLSTSTSTASATAKPKSTKAVKQRSPSPSPPPPPPPRLQTIRLEIKLGGPDAYEVNIAQLAKDTGQRAPTPPRVHKKADSSDSEDEGEDGKSPKSKKGKGKDGKVIQSIFRTLTL